MKKVILVPSNTDLNRGDQALIWESISLINKVYDNPQISLIKTGVTEEDVKRQTAQTAELGYNFLDPILKHPSRICSNKGKHILYSIINYLLWGFQAIMDLIFTSLLISPSTFLNSIGKKRLNKDELITLNSIKDSDALFVKGGGFIHSYGKISDPYVMYYSLFLLLLGIKYKKNIYILPNSIGPLKNRIARNIVKSILHKCKVVMVRESISQRYVENDLKVACYQFPDLGYYLTESDLDINTYLKMYNIPCNKQKVGITLRPYRFPEANNPDEKYTHYIKTIAGLVKVLSEKHYHVVFVAHTLGPSSHENDSLAIKEVIRHLDTNIAYSYIYDENLNCKDLMKLYSVFDILIGTRFHSVIFAQNVLVPSLAISYGGNKGQGIMADLDMEEYVIPIDDMDISKLLEKFDSLLANKDNIKTKLKNLKSELQQKKIELENLLIHNILNN